MSRALRYCGFLKKEALGIIDVNAIIIHDIAWQARGTFLGQLAEMVNLNCLSVVGFKNQLTHR
jgi:hypothetical protein